MKPSALLVLALVLLVPLTVATTERLATRSYVAGAGDVYVHDCVFPQPPVGLGGVCFPLEGTLDPAWRGQTASIEAHDAAGHLVGGLYRFEHRGVLLERGRWCGEATLDVPQFALELYLFVEEAFASLGCGGGPGTTGTIAARFADARPST